MNFPGEQWRSVPHPVGWYEASDLGRIRSLKNAWGRNRSEPKILKPYNYESGQGLMLKGKTRVKVHSLILLAFVGKRPAGQVIDHVDGNPFNNNLSNLRYCTPSQNGHNSTKARGVSGLRGVTPSKHGHRWEARLRLQGQRIHIGSFRSKIEASLAYERKRSELLGAFVIRKAPFRQQKANGSSGESHLNEKTEIKGSRPKRQKARV